MRALKDGETGGLTTRIIIVLAAACAALTVSAAPASAGHNGYSPPTSAFSYGNSTTTTGYNCIGQYNELMLNSRVAYTPGKKVGEVWWARVEVTLTGNPCGGSEGFNIGINVRDTHYAISNANPVMCEYMHLQNHPQWGDITGQTINSSSGSFKACTRDGTSSGMVLTQGGSFRVTFPVYSKKVLRGISGANDKLTGTIQTSTSWPTNTSTPNPFQYVVVDDNPPRVEYGNPATTSITQTSAGLNGRLYNFYRTGNMYIEYGKTTAYGTVALNRATTENDSYVYFDDYRISGLQPGTTYHWRVRFVSGGQTFLGADRQFTTAGSSQDTTPPDTNITGGPSGTVSATTAQFTFTSSEAGSSFECMLDQGNFGSCTSPKSYSGLGNGEHTFRVRATDAAGNTDQSPATRTWTG